MELLGLPAEVLLLICQRLGQCDLYNASLTCRKVSNVANDALYHAPYCPRLGENGSSTSLLHTISKNPRRARLVRHLRFNYVNITASTELSRGQREKRSEVFDSFESSDPYLKTAMHRRARKPYDSDDLPLALILYHAVHLESLMLGNAINCLL